MEILEYSNHNIKELIKNPKKWKQILSRYVKEGNANEVSRLRSKLEIYIGNLGRIKRNFIVASSNFNGCLPKPKAAKFLRKVREAELMSEMVSAIMSGEGPWRTGDLLAIRKKVPENAIDLHEEYEKIYRKAVGIYIDEEDLNKAIEVFAKDVERRLGIKVKKKSEDTIKYNLIYMRTGKFIVDNNKKVKASQKEQTNDLEYLKKLKKNWKNMEEKEKKEELKKIWKIAINGTEEEKIEILRLCKKHKIKELTGVAYNERESKNLTLRKEAMLVIAFIGNEKDRIIYSSINMPAIKREEKKKKPAITLKQIRKDYFGLMSDEREIIDSKLKYYLKSDKVDDRIKANVLEFIRVLGLRHFKDDLKEIIKSNPKKRVLKAAAEALSDLCV